MTCRAADCVDVRLPGREANIRTWPRTGKQGQPVTAGASIPGVLAHLCDAPGVVGTRYAVYAWGIRGEVCPADLIYTPPDVPHSIYAHHSGGRCLGFAATFTPEGAPTNTPAEFDNWPPQS
jgi:hypothetical protein